MNYSIKDENIDVGICLETFNPRKKIFQEILEKFNNQPINIFQVGAIERLNPHFVMGSGWSDTIFGEYVNTHGGKLRICDIDMSHIKNSAKVANHCGYEPQFILGKAEYNMCEHYDLIYLDGSNDPEETLQQFKQIDLKSTVVLVDDFDIKGELIKDLYEFKIYNIANKMALLDIRETKNGNQVR